MKGAALYDLRRSLLNKALIIIVIAVVALGAGIAYLELSLSRSIAPYYIVIEPFHNGSALGLLLSPSGSPLGNARIYVIYPNSSPGVLVTNSSGYVLIGSGVGIGPVYVNGANRSVMLGTAALVNVNLRAGRATLFFSVYPEPGAREFKVYVRQAELGLRGRIINYTAAQYLGEYGPGIWRAEVRVGPEPAVVITAVPVNSSSATNETTELMPPELELKSVAFQPMATAANIMAEFLPLVALFLTNDLFARLRSTRAIEFLLARPITKGQLLTSRYSAGLLALLISSLLASAALGLIVYLMAGPVVTLSDALVVFAASFASAAAFYSLLYLVSAATRGHFIAIAVILYIVLYLFNFSFIAAAVAQRPWLVYAGPLGAAGSIISGYLGVSSLLQSGVSYSEAAASLAAWAVVPIAAAIALYSRSGEP